MCCRFTGQHGLDEVEENVEGDQLHRSKQEEMPSQERVMGVGCVQEESRLWLGCLAGG